MVPLPVVRGPLLRPRATVQVGVLWQRAGIEPAYGLNDRGPNDLPPASILAHLQHTGTQGCSVHAVEVRWTPHPAILDPGFRRGDTSG